MKERKEIVNAILDLFEVNVLLNQELNSLKQSLRTEVNIKDIIPKINNELTETKLISYAINTLSNNCISDYYGVSAYLDVNSLDGKEMIVRTEFNKWCNDVVTNDTDIFTKDELIILFNKELIDLWNVKVNKKLEELLEKKKLEESNDED